MIDRCLLNQSLMKTLSPTRISILFADNPKIILTYQEAALVVEVCDTGIEFRKMNKNFFFDPFFRGSNVEGMNGTGLGLSIVKISWIKWVERSVFAGANNGTNVTLSIPINH